MISVRAYSFYYILFIVSLSGFLFGYTPAVISGPIILIVQEFQLSEMAKGFLVAMPLFAALVGALACSSAAERLGRKVVLISAAFIFLIGFVLTAFAHSYAILLVSRGISGIAVGIVSVVTPIYLGEISPPGMRGRNVAVYIAMITVGILGSYIVGREFVLQGEWRGSFAFGTIPAAIQVLGLFFIPESPAWMEKRKSVEHLALKKEMILWKSFLKPPLRTFFLIGIGISMFQQLTGINGVIYYAPSIFAGNSDAVSSSAFLASISIAIVNVCASIVALFLIDKIGRRTLLFIGLIGIVMSFAFISFCMIFFFPCKTSILLIGFALYVGFFQVSIGPVTWVILSEIFPLKIREMGVTLASGINWLSGYIVALTFPLMMQAMRPSGTFLFYAGVSFLAYLFVLRRVPETRGKSLEQIEDLIKSQTRKLS